jgi:hypothetical protein
MNELQFKKSIQHLVVHTVHTDSSWDSKLVSLYQTMLGLNWKIVEWIKGRVPDDVDDV